MQDTRLTFLALGIFEVGVLRVSDDPFMPSLLERTLRLLVFANRHSVYPERPIIF